MLSVLVQSSSAAPSVVTISGVIGPARASAVGVDDCFQINAQLGWLIRVDYREGGDQQGGKVVLAAAFTADLRSRQTLRLVVRTTQPSMN